MADRNNKPHRPPPVSYSRNQHDESEHLVTADVMQRAADALIAETQSYSGRYSNGDTPPSSKSTRATQPACPKSTRELVDPFKGFDEQDHLISPSPRGRQIVWSETDQEDFSPDSRSNIFPFPSLFGKPSKEPVVATQTSPSQSGNRRRDSIKSNASVSVIEPPPRFGENWQAANDSTATLTDKSNNSRIPRHITSSRDLRQGDKHSRRRSFARAPDMTREPGPAHASTASLPASAGRPKSDGVLHEDFLAALAKARESRASGPTVLRSQPRKTPKSEQHPTPSSIRIGKYTYVRQEDEADPETEEQEVPEDTTPKGSPDGPPLTLLHEIAFVLVICIAQSLMLAGISQALIPAGIIGSSLGLARPADLAWFSAAYALTSGAFVLPAGRLGDLFGHKTVFIVGFFWFATWSFITGFALQVQESGANGMIYFNVCRAMQGIGPALQISNAQAMLGRAYKPGPRKALVMSLFGAAAPIGFVGGGAMSSVFAQLLTWPWSFWALAAVCVAFGSLSILILPKDLDKRKMETRRDGLWTRLDGFGIILGVTGLVLFSVSWNQAAQVSWTTPYTYFLLIISVLFLSAFVYIELHAKYPILPLAAMSFQTSVVLLCTAAGWGCFAVWVFYSFQFLELLRGWTPLLAAASYGPGPVTGIVASLLVARYMVRLGPHWIMLISMVAFSAGSLLMATAPVKQMYWGNTFFSVLIMPFGMDMSSPAGMMILSDSMDKEHQVIVASLVVTVMNYSISTALGFAAMVETRVNRSGEDILLGFRSAQYFGLGLGVLGCGIALAFALITVARQRATAGPGDKEKQAERAPSILVSDTEVSALSEQGKA